MIQMMAEIKNTNRITTIVALLSCSRSGHVTLESSSQHSSMKSRVAVILDTIAIRRPATWFLCASCAAYNDGSTSCTRPGSGVQTFVLRLVVVPFLALGAAQRDPFSPHYLPLPVGRWAPLALLLRAAALSGGSLLRYTVVRDAAEGVSTPRRSLGWSSRGPKPPRPSHHLAFFRLLQLSSCYRPLISSCYCCLLRFRPAPASAPSRRRDGESSYVQGFGFSLSRSVPAYGVAEGERKIESALLHNLRHDPRAHRASAFTDGKA